MKREEGRREEGRGGERRGGERRGEERILSNCRTNMASFIWLHKLCGEFSLLLPSTRKPQYLLGWKLICFQGLALVRQMFFMVKKLRDNLHNHAYQLPQSLGRNKIIKDLGEMVFCNKKSVYM